MVSLLNQITVHSRNGIRQSSIARSSVGWKYVQGVRQNHGNRSRIWTQKWTSYSKESPRNILGSHVYVAALILGFHSPHTWRYSFKRQILRKISISGWLCTITPVVLVQEANPHKNFHIRLFVHNLSYDTCLSGRSSEKKYTLAWLWTIFPA